MNKANTQLWQDLHRVGLVEGSQPKQAQLDSPWFVKLLLAFSGWLAAIFLFIFIAIGLQSIFENTLIAAATGIITIAIAYKILQQPNNEFFEHLGLAISLVGQGMLSFAIFESDWPTQASAWPLILLLETSLASRNGIIHFHSFNRLIIYRWRHHSLFSCFIMA